MEIVIRDSTLFDVNKIMELLKDCDLLLKGVDSIQSFDDKISNDPSSVVVAEYNDEIIGTIFITKDPWVSTIYHMCVSHKYRRTSVAWDMVEKIKENCNTHNIFGHIAADNIASREVALKQGFSELKENLIAVRLKGNKDGNNC